MITASPACSGPRSTNGRGVHAYLRVEKPGTNARGLDGALLALERWLRYQLSVQKWDIQDIEVKGRPPIFDWGDQKYELLDVKMGSLAKLPVDALDRPEDLMDTTLKGTSELRRLGAEVPADWCGREKEVNCTTYSLPISTGSFGEIVPDDLEPFIPDSRGREWPFWVERMSRIGLVEDDTMAHVIFELAKWLLWIELFEDDDREARTIELLQGYVLARHNGHVTRLNEGKDEEVLSHVERIVEGACIMSAESKELFLRVRQKRQQGKYERLIEIVPILEGRHVEGVIPVRRRIFRGREDITVLLIVCH